FPQPLILFPAVEDEQLQPVVTCCQKCHTIGCDEGGSLGLACSMDESLHSYLLLSEQILESFVLGFQLSTPLGIQKGLVEPPKFMKRLSSPEPGLYITWLKKTL
ncbi:hypothetical protein INR49_030199, partial [Caranx melampygus]